MTIQKPDKTHGWRGTADLWIDAGYHLLIDGGVEAVKVMPLARALGLSRTSFYWHFTDREALLDAIIDRWEAKNTGNLVARCNAPAGSICAACPGPGIAQPARSPPSGFCRTRGCRGGVDRA